MSGKRDRSGSHSVSTFQDDWLKNGNYKLWLSKSSKVTEAYCKLCKRTIKIDSGGSLALDSHKKGKTHEQKENQRKANVNGTFFYSFGSQDSAGIPDKSDDDGNDEDDHNNVELE